MSLRIKINSVFSQQSTGEIEPIPCLCKLTYGTAKYHQKVGALKVAQLPFRHRSLPHSNDSILSGTDENHLSESLIIKTNDENVLVHKLNSEDSELKEGDQLEINCFKLRRTAMRGVRPFAKYTMLMDQLKVKSDNNSDGEAQLTIDDFLMDPGNSKILKEKIQFNLHFNQYLNSKKQYSLDNKKMKKFINASITPVTTIDFIKTIRKTGEFALKHFNPGSNLLNVSVEMNIDEEELVRKFIFEVGRTPILLTLALSFVMKYELSEKQKATINRLLIKKNPFSCWDFNLSDNVHNLVKQYFKLEVDELLTSWQVTLNILEIKNLIGVNEKVYCVVEIGDKKFTTKERHIDKMQFGEDDNEEFKFIARIESQSLQKAFNSKIAISIYFSTFYPFSPIFVGKFQTDLATVYDQPGHSVSRKWGEIICKNETPPGGSRMAAGGAHNSGDSGFSLKGYVKFDISLQRDETNTNKVFLDDYNREDTDDIENNLFIPYGLNESRQPIKLLVKIDHAFILSKKVDGLFTQLRTSLLGTKSPNNLSEDSPSPVTISELNPFVRVIFDGETKQTPVLRNTDNPNWKYTLEFSHLFPPLVRLLRIQLCSVDSAGYEHVLASEFITINNISAFVKDEAYLPTYGPRYIDLDDDLDDEPANLRKKKIIEDNLYDELFIDGNLNPNYYKERTKRSTYTSIMPCKPIARLLISIKSKKQSQLRKSNDSNDKNDELNQLLEKYEPFSAAIDYPKTDFVAFAIINDVSMIDFRFRKGPIRFQLCVGNHGYSDQSSGSFLFGQKKGLATNFTEQQVPVQLDPLMPIYLANDKVKQCVSLKFSIDDLRHFMLKNNYIQYVLRTIIENYVEIKSSVWSAKFYHLNKNWRIDSSHKGYVAHERIFSLVSSVKDYLNKNFLASEFITSFDRHRVQQIISQLTIVVDLLKLIFALISKFRQSASNESFTLFADKIIKSCLLNVRNLLREPFNIFPDLSLYMLCNDQPVGVCIVKSKDIVWSADEQKMGCICAKMVYIDVKSLNPNHHGESERENIARMRVFLWLGLASETDVIFSNNYLPAGYGLSAEHVNDLGLPTQIFFNERHVFQLNTYLYQGRDMLMLDIAGCSDPFARISLNSQSVTSKTIDNTVNPTWNQTLVIREVVLYGDVSALALDPPEICVDIFDEDPFGIKEFMGRFYMKPVVNRNGNKPPKLAWYKLFNNYEHAGDILASFELIYKKEEKISFEASDSEKTVLAIESPPSVLQVPIPLSIKPKTKPYTLEVLYWGIRNLREINFMKIGQQKLSLDIEIGDKRLDPVDLDHAVANENFPSHLTHRKYSIEIPELDEYKPHLSIRCEEYGSLFLYNRLHKTLETIEKQFSKKILIGSCTIKTIGKYCYDNEKLSRFCKSNSNRNYLQSMSSTEDFSARFTSKAKRYTKKKPRVVSDPEQDLEYLDFWSKYFAALSIKRKEGKKFNEENKRAKFSVETEETDEEALNSSVETNSVRSEKSFKSLRCSTSRIKIFTKKNKKLNISKKKPLLKSVGLCQNPTATAIPKLEIQKITVYDSELEKHFDFSETLKSFNLLIGTAKKEPHFKNSQQCQFKGNFLLYDEAALNISLKNMLDIKGGFLKNTPQNLPIKIRVHVYILKVFMVNPIGLIGNRKLQPMIVLNYGSQELKLENIKSKSTEMTIGKCFEFEARFPNEAQLTISLRDGGFVPGWNDLIGQTVIDLEDRFYSNLYATCGLPKKYDTSGYNEWRDIFQPQQILTKLCKKFGLLPPKYMDKQLTIFDVGGNAKGSYRPPQRIRSTETDDSRVRSSTEDTDSDGGETLLDKDLSEQNYREQLALDALNDWKSITGVALVPEHVETRSLYNTVTGTELEQGKIQMWVDMFPVLSEGRQQFKSVDVSERRPKKFQLRVVVLTTKDVALDDTNLLTGEKSSDIYVKSFLCDMVGEAQKTDIHYRSLDGEGNFNWRMIFDFGYLPAEQRIVTTHKVKLGFVTIERKMKPKLTIQCLDWDHVSADDKLGILELNLCKFIKGANTADACGAKMHDPDWPKINMFQVRKHRGWWPFLSCDPTKPSKGKVEIEFTLLSEKEALADPAGLGRGGPNPLSEPVRPETSFLWLTNPMQTFRMIIWKQYWKQILLGFFVFLLVLILLIVVVQLPSQLMKALITGG